MYNRRKKKRNRGACLIAYLLAVAVFLVWPIGKMTAAKGGTPRTVRIGFFPMEGYNEKEEDGSYSGMDVEYLENLCDYVNWNIEYVECESWDEALKMLFDKQVDLVGSAQYSAERAEKYQYANLASGYTFGAVAVEGDSPLAYEDFEAMSDITYGVVRSYIRKEEFYEYLSDHDIHRPKVKEYKNTEALQEALQKGEIDALVHSLTEVREGQRVIGRFAPMPIYYISYQGNDDVMRELNQGIADIKMNRPGLENELMVKYYDSRLDQTILLTSEEKDYLHKKEKLTVGYLDGYYPFSYVNDGEYQGLAKQVLEEVSVSTGAIFTYTGLENMEEARRSLTEGSIDILCYCGESPKSMKQDGLLVTKAYAQAPHVIIMKRSTRSETLHTLAVARDRELEHDLGDFIDETVQILTFDSQMDCLYAVKSGEADAAMCDGYLAEYLLGSELRFNNMEIHTVLSEVHPIYMAVKEDVDSPLLGILNKELLRVSDKMVNDYMLQDNFYSRMSLENFISDHSVPILLILCAVGATVILVLHHMLMDSRRIQRLMYRDPEFNIWNLNYLKYRASVKLSAEKSGKYAIAYTDVRQFRRYNTLYGWQAGQKILELMIQVIAEELDNEKELYARSYGDHFVLFVKYETIGALKRRLRELENRISQCIYDQVQLHMTLVIGVSCIPEGENDVQHALADSIQAAESRKDSYSNGIQIYDDKLRSQLRERHERERLLEAVDINESFAAYYQAKVDIRSEKIVGAEALVRFKDPTDNGAIRAPGFFVPYYEKTGRITEIDFLVMEAVCRMLRRRLDAGKQVVPVSCNFSRLHFIKEGFPDRFEQLIEKYQVPKELIEVEITETIVVEELLQQKVKENMEILRKKGVRLSIDDFGSGYSSLGVFEQIPASVIKLDRSFLLNNEDHVRQVKIMKNIVNLAQDLDAQVVCEGVETDKDTELMMEIGAYVAQGYRYCRPVPEPVFEEMLDG